MNELHRFSVGEPYNPARRHWPEAGVYVCRGGGHELLVFWESPTPSDIKAIRNGDLDLALVLEQPVIWLLYKIAGACSWSDAPYTIHRVAANERIVPQHTDGVKDRTILQVILVDAATGIVRAMRQVTFSPQMTALLHTAIAAQERATYEETAYNRAVDAGYRRWPTADSMVRSAVVSERAGRV